MVTLAILGEVTPGAILTKCGMWGDMGDIITCAIFGDCRLSSVGVVRGLILPSPTDLRYLPVTVPCDRVICNVPVIALSYSGVDPEGDGGCTAPSKNMMHCLYFSDNVIVLLMVCRPLPQNE